MWGLLLAIDTSGTYPAKTYSSTRPPRNKYWLYVVNNDNVYYISLSNNLQYR